MPSYRINVKGGSPSENKKWSKEISNLATQVEKEFQRLKQSRIALHNQRVIEQAMRDSRR